MKKIMLMLAILSLFLIGCQGVDVSKMSDEDLQRISEKAVVCNEPYIRFGSSCCLDQNKNNICDSDEGNTIATQQTPSTGEQVPSTETDVCPNDISLKFIEFNDVKQVCLNNQTNTIEFTIQNSGAVPLGGVIVQAVGSTSIKDKKIESSMPKGAIVKDTIQYSLSADGPLKQIRFTPMTTSKVACAQNALVNEDVSVCI